MIQGTRKFPSFAATISYRQTPSYERDFKNAICQMKGKPVTSVGRQAALKTKYSPSNASVSLARIRLAIKCHNVAMYTAKLLLFICQKPGKQHKIYGAFVVLRLRHGHACVRLPTTFFLNLLLRQGQNEGALPAHQVSSVLELQRQSANDLLAVVLRCGTIWRGPISSDFI